MAYDLYLFVWLNMEAMQKEQEQKTKAILQKLSKLQEYNEINDMRAIFMSKQIQNILEKLY